MEQEIQQAVGRAIKELEDTVLRQALRGLDPTTDNAVSKPDKAGHQLDSTNASPDLEFQRMGPQTNDTEGIIRGALQVMNSKMNNTDSLLQQELQKSKSEMSDIRVSIRNSKISHLGQKVHPLPAYDLATKQPLPIPKGFPATALGLYNLQYSRNWRKLKDLLVYYRLEPEVIHLAEFFANSELDSDLESDAGSDSESEPEPTKSEFSSSVESNPAGAVSILARRLGVNYNVLHEKIIGYESQRKGTKGQKRRPDDSLEKKESKRIILLSDSEGEIPADKVVEPDSKFTTPTNDEESPVGADTIVDWKSDSAKVLQHYQDMGYGSTSLKDEGVEEERTSVSENRPSRNGPSSPTTREITSPEIQQNLG